MVINVYYTLEHIRQFFPTQQFRAQPKATRMTSAATGILFQICKKFTIISEFSVYSSAQFSESGDKDVLILIETKT